MGLFMKGLTKLPPAHQVQIQTIARISAAMTHTAQKFVPCQAELEHFELKLDLLHTMVTDDDNKASPSEVLEIVKQLELAATDPEVSSTMCLPKLGGVYINEIV